MSENNQTPPVNDGGGTQTQITPPATQSGAQESHTPDLSAVFVDGQPGTFDQDKIVSLMKDLENSKKSASYFQSMYMKKNEVPETIDGYSKAFKADSMYEAALAQDNVKGMIKAMQEWGLKQGIGTRALNSFIDYTLKNAVQKNIIDLRSDEQKAADKKKYDDEQLAKIQPMLDGMHKTKDENDTIIQKFLDGKSVFTNDPEMKEYLINLADSGAMGYKLLTMMTHQIEHSGIPVVSGTIKTQDKAALMAEIQKIDDPQLRFQKMQEFYNQGGK